MKFFLKLLLVIGSAVGIIFTPTVALATDFFVAPGATAQGTGSKDQPWTLQTALDHPVGVQPGDTIWLRDGKYGTGGITTFKSKLVGTASQPIIIRQYPGERAIVDGTLQIEAPAAHIWFWGFEVTNTDDTRSGKPGEIPSVGLNLHSREGHKAINMIVHNAGHPGIGFWRGVGGNGAEIHGSILWGNGFYDTHNEPGTPEKPWIRGSGTYMQNDAGERLVTDNITFRNFTLGLKTYGDAGGSSGFRFIGNMVFDNPMHEIYAGQRVNPIKDLVMRDNVAYDERVDRATLTAGYQHQIMNEGAVIENNIAVSGGSVLEIAPWIEATVKNNLFVSLARSPLQLLEKRYINASWPDQPSETKFQQNTYYSAQPQVGYEETHTTTYTTINVSPFITSANKIESEQLTFASWQARGQDLSSQFFQGKPQTNQIVVRANKYEAGRGHVAILNWQNKVEDQVDLSSLLRSGDVYEVRDSQNYFTVIKSGTYDGSPISLPLNLTAVAPIRGNITHFTNVHTSSQFNVFVVSVPSRVLEYPDGRPNSTLSLPSTKDPGTESPQCKADINSDKVVDTVDYSLIVVNFLASPLKTPRADLNKDGVVDLSDYSEIVKYFFQSCP